MTAPAKKNKHDQSTIERIRSTVQAGSIIKRLNDHINGVVELSSTQVKAAEILLRKTLPDLSSVEGTSTVTHHYVARVPAPAKTVSEWQQQHAAALNPHPTPQ